MKFHTGASIDGLLRQTTRKLGVLFQMSGLQARRDLEDERAEGHKLIPSSDCDNFDPFEHGCLGHLEDGKPNPCLLGKCGPECCKVTCDKCEHYKQEAKLDGKN